MQVYVWDVSDYDSYSQQINIAIANSKEEAIQKILAIKPDSDQDKISGCSPVAYWEAVLRDLKSKLETTTPEVYSVENFAIATGYFE